MKPAPLILYIFSHRLHSLFLIHPYTEAADFDGTVINITYPADEGLSSPIPNVRASIPVVNDTIDEAEQQQFIAYLEITNAINPGGVGTGRNVIICRIDDDDGK